MSQPRKGEPADRHIWLQSYPAGVPAVVRPSPYGSLSELISASCSRFSARPAFSAMGRALSYAELDAQANAFAGWLQSIGLKRGDRVAVMMPNVLQYPIAVSGILRAGMVVVNVNPLYTPRELAHQLGDSGARAIIVLENFAATVEKALAQAPVAHVCVAALGDLLGPKGALVNLVVRRVRKMVPAYRIPGAARFNAALKAGRAHGLDRVAIAPSDIAFLQYTGGTTGVAKGATLTHANVLANVMQLGAWLDSAFVGRNPPEALTFLCALPLYHIFALTVNLFMGVDQGAHNVLVANPRDLPTLVKEMARHEIHVFPGLNTLFNALLSVDAFKSLDFSRLLLTLAGGMAVQRHVAENWRAATGCPIAEGYGLSETSPVVSANRFDAKDFTGTIGLPLPSTEIDIRDDDGLPLPIGRIGEICVRGPQVMTGYWNRPDETAMVMTDDGFFRTGDMGFMDDRGYTKIVDRKKDMILVSGFNVYPNEIEEVAAAMPGIVEAAAIGVADPHSGEAVKLIVVRRDRQLTEVQIKAWCAENLTNYKRPKYVEFRDDLPKSNVGKILRRSLRDAESS